MQVNQATIVDSFFVEFNVKIRRDLNIHSSIDPSFPPPKDTRHVGKNNELIMLRKQTIFIFRYVFLFVIVFTISPWFLLMFPFQRAYERTRFTQPNDHRHWNSFSKKKNNQSHVRHRLEKERSQSKICYWCDIIKVGYRANIRFEWEEKSKFDVASRLNLTKSSEKMFRF